MTEYEVYLGEEPLYNVLSVQMSLEREVKAFDGLGQGKFPLVGGRGLCQWEIRCQWDQWPADGYSEGDSLIRWIQGLMQQEDSERLVVCCPGRHSSQRVFVRQLLAEERHSGVFDVTLQLVEDRQLQVLSADPSALQRPGRTPSEQKVQAAVQFLTPQQKANPLMGVQLAESSPLTQEEQAQLFGALEPQETQERASGTAQLAYQQIAVAYDWLGVN